MKIVITGANGMLGHMLGTLFGRALTKAEADHEVLLVNRSQLDITNQADVLAYMTAQTPDVIINAAAYTAVDDCESNSALANQVNGIGPRHLAEAAKKIQATLFHFSTDYIFNGLLPSGYNEAYAEIDPINAYGESKALGEKYIQSTADQSWNKYYIIRTAWLYGPDGNNFVDTMLKLADEKDELKVVNDQHGSPTYTKDLATQVLTIMTNQPAYGIYHVTNSGSCTWFEFAQEIMRLAHKTVNVQPCSSAEFSRPAKRPAYSLLVNTKLPAMRSWQEALADYLLA